MSWNKKSDEQFKEELRVKRPDITTKDKYTTNKTKMLFECSEGHSWETSPNHILNDCSACPYCSHNTKYLSRRSSSEYFKNRLDEVDSEFTVLGEYTTARTKIEVVCPKGHKSFCFPYGLVRGSSCLQCKGYAKFKEGRPITLYYAKINHDNKFYYKIGLTQKGFAKRFMGQEALKMELLYETIYDSVFLGYEAEQSILYAFSEFITKDKVLRKGNTEIFNSDVLNLDSQTYEDFIWH